MNEAKSVPVWDIAVRIFHWSLVLAYIVTWLTEDDMDELHAFAGYVVLGLICFRVVWGFIGTQHARFSDFVYSPEKIMQYLKSLMAASPEHYFGHNPAGGAMIILLLLSLFGATISGLKVYGVEGHGPMAQAENTTIVKTAETGTDGQPLPILAALNPVSNAYADDDDDEEHADGEENEAEEFWEEIHEFFANLSLLLVFIHVMGVAISSLLHKENLVRAMVTGRKQIPSGDKTS